MNESTNPYKPNDKVFISIKGAEIEATVRLVWKDEVQVRVPTGGLIWRTVRTVRATAAPTTESQAADAVETNPVVQAAAETAQSANVMSEGAEAAPAATVEAEATATVAEPAQPSVGTAEQLACGVPEAEADRKHAKKSKRRR